MDAVARHRASNGDVLSSLEKKNVALRDSTLERQKMNSLSMSAQQFKQSSSGKNAAIAANLEEERS